jgi:hypothetical protein
LDDVLACPCGGLRRVVADISERQAIVALLTHLGIPTEPPPIARARDPSFEKPKIKRQLATMPRGAEGDADGEGSAGALRLVTASRRRG